MTLPAPNDTASMEGGHDLYLHEEEHICKHVRPEYRLPAKTSIDH